MSGAGAAAVGPDLGSVSSGSPRWTVRDIESTTRQAARLGLFFLSLYLLTMGGHMGSSDDETMYVVTRSLATHGGLDLDLESGAPMAPIRGVDGKYYAHYGLIPSIMALPLYVLGDAAAGWFPPAYHEYVTRLFVGMLDPVLTALTAVLLFLLGRQLGYSPRVATLLSLAFGLATVAWPQSKYFWNEPVAGFWLVLATYASVLSARQSSSWWPLVAGLALGFSAASRIGIIVVAPGYWLYLLLHGTSVGSKVSVRALLSRRVVLFSVALTVVVLAIASGNMARFGEPWKTGHWQGAPVGVALRGALDASAVGVGDHRHGVWGIIGMLISPGKGLFIHAPIVLLSVIGFRAFWSRLRPEAMLIAFVFATQWLLNGAIFYWHGDDSWGPRYLVPIVGLLTVPAGAALCWSRGWRRRAAWALVAILAGLGVLAELGGVLVNYNVYNSRSGGVWGPGAEARRWEPARSPVVVHWSYLGQRVGAWLRPPDVQLSKGFYYPENVSSGPLPRWTAGEGTITVVPRQSGTLRLRLRYGNFRPTSMGPTRVDLLINGGPPSRETFRVEESRNRGTVRLTLEVTEGSDPIVIAVRSNTWKPSEAHDPDDDRLLGILVEDLDASIGGHTLSVGESVPPQPLPVSEERPWSVDAYYWFFVPDTHVVDLWPWYVYTSGLPRWPVLLALIPLAGLTLSGTLLVRAARRDRQSW